MLLNAVVAVSEPNNRSPTKNPIILKVKQHLQSYVAGIYYILSFQQLLSRNPVLLK